MQIILLIVNIYEAQSANLRTPSKPHIQIIRYAYSK